METADYCETHGTMWRRSDGSCGKCAEGAKLKHLFPTSDLLSDEEQLGRAAKHELQRRMPKDVAVRLREHIDPLAHEAADEILQLKAEIVGLRLALSKIAELARKS
jgi:hypothetical protein